MSSDIRTALSHIHTMTGSAIRNYAIAGLTSRILNEGTVRLFTMENIQMTNIVPHSHRYDLACLVLKGSVQNIIWSERQPEDNDPGYRMSVSEQIYLGTPGSYEVNELSQKRCTIKNSVYTEGQFYCMTAEEIHSINFSHDAEVLIFQGPERFKSSVILEPMGNDGVIPIHQTLSWMFKAD